MPGAGLSAAALIMFDAMSAAGIIPEVTSRSESPHAYDWRAAAAELQLALGQEQEENNFNSVAYELGLGLPNDAGSMLRFGLRRVNVYPTPSSDDIGRTPFKQSSGETRYELFGGYGLGLLEGRAMTRLSPKLPDFETSTLLWLGAHYSHPEKRWVPELHDPPDPAPGQDPVNATFNLEVGLRWTVYTPQSLGFVFEALENRPIGKTGQLHQWVYLNGGLVWSFGAQ